MREWCKENCAGINIFKTCQPEHIRKFSVRQQDRLHINSIMRYHIASQWIQWVVLEYYYLPTRSKNTSSFRKKMKPLRRCHMMQNTDGQRYVIAIFGKRKSVPIICKIAIFMVTHLSQRQNFFRRIDSCNRISKIMQHRVYVTMTTANI